jgi:hypothetical protein
LYYLEKQLTFVQNLDFLLKVKIMEQITLELPSNVAKRFYTLSSDDKNIIVSFLSAWLTNKGMTEKKRQKAKEQLLQTMSVIGQKATERGMTDEILLEILNEQ